MNKDISIKEAIDELVSMKPNLIGLSIIGNSSYDMAVEALEKQIPKKPFMAPMPGFDGEVASHLSCPGCKMVVVNVWNTDYKPLYCCNCGQRFDWSKEGE